MSTRSNAQTRQQHGEQRQQTDGLLISNRARSVYGKKHVHAACSGGTFPLEIKKIKKYENNALHLNKDALLSSHRVRGTTTNEREKTMKLETRFCKNCEMKTAHTVESVNHLLHFILTVITAGCWLPIWVVAGLKKKAKQCQECRTSSESGSNLLAVVCGLVALFFSPLGFFLMIAGSSNV